jgi:hypothetical protein
MGHLGNEVFTLQGGQFLEPVATVKLALQVERQLASVTRLDSGWEERVLLALLINLL